MWGDRRRLGHEKEAVCIVSGGSVCEEIDAGWVAENKVVWTVSGIRIWGDRRWLRYENEAVCILSRGMYVRRSTLVGSRRIRWYVL